MSDNDQSSDESSSQETTQDSTPNIPGTIMEIQRVQDSMDNDRIEKK
jgi:hypothetical protein